MCVPGAVMHKVPKHYIVEIVHQIHSHFTVEVCTGYVSSGDFSFIKSEPTCSHSFCPTCNVIFEYHAYRQVCLQKFAALSSN